MPATPLQTRVRAWVQKICDELDIKYTELARRAGIDPSTLTRFMNNPTYKHNLSHTNIQKIVDATGYPPPNTGRSQEGVATVQHLQHKVTARRVRVVGAAAAGLWKDVSLLSQDDYADEQVSFPEEPGYSGHTQYAILVEGNSVNRKILDGEYAICVAWPELGIDPKTGHYVHVERSRGGLTEATIKLVKIGIGGRVELWPDSTDPKFQEPIILDHSDEDTEVRIRGLVITASRPFRY